MVVSSWTMVSRPGAPGAAAPTKQRRRFGIDKSMLPAPYPTRSTVIGGIDPDEAASVVRIAAPVGVTSSALTPLS